MHRRSPLWQLIAVLFVAVIGLAGCSDDDKSASDSAVDGGDDTTEDASSGGSDDLYGDDATDAGASEDDGAADDSGDADAPASKGNLTISGFAFGKVTADAGSEVTVANLDSATHTATADNGEFDSGEIAGNGTGTFTAPDEAGDYEFHCEIHPSLKGTLTVV
ncbi:MAG TPA: cupredoxin domain-containing protein [Acidimicrobiia bacterium]|nr:cupredoxin domain-containing protein [Acidimicrobiia bacterium]